VFFGDVFGGAHIGVVWNPTAFMPTNLKVAAAGHLAPSQTLLPTASAGGGKAKAARATAVPNVFEVVDAMRAMGEGLVDRVEFR
jgi:hypothetical protein